VWGRKTPKDSIPYFLRQSKAFFDKKSQNLDFFLAKTKELCYTVIKIYMRGMI